MTAPDPLTFAEQWVANWNARDVEAVLRHFDDNVVFTSATAARVVPASAGVISGKVALRTYWTQALALVEDLHFELDAVYAGVSCLAIHYGNENQDTLSETLEFASGLVVRGHAMRLSAPRPQPS